FKERKDGSRPEITTLQADVAWITFDRPVTSFSEIAYRKIVEAELNGKVNVRNDRGRKERDQDLILKNYREDTHVPSGPIYYREDTHQIWTNSVVYVDDHRSKPKPHTVTGKGLRLELLTDAPPPGARPPARKQQHESITGVKWISLQSGVKMVIQLDGNNGFLGGSPTAAEAAGEPARAVCHPARPLRADDHDARHVPLRRQQGPRRGSLRRPDQRRADAQPPASGHRRPPPPRRRQERLAHLPA